MSDTKDKPQNGIIYTSILYKLYITNKVKICRIIGNFEYSTLNKIMIGTSYI